jgi:hypothetical protein
LHTRRRKKSKEYETNKRRKGKKKGGKNKEENKDNVMHLETGQNFLGSCGVHSRNISRNIPRVHITEGSTWASPC